MDWKPQQEPLKQLTGFLNDSLNARDPAAQKNAEVMLKQAKGSPDFDNYLAYLFTTSQIPPGIELSADGHLQARLSAAIMLKNHVRTNVKSMNANAKQYIQTAALHGLQDQNKQVRSYAGNIIAEIVRSGGIITWPNILVELVSLAENQSQSAPVILQESAMEALRKVCEDNRKELDTEISGQTPLDFLFPKLLQLAAGSTAKIRADALNAVGVFILEQPTAVQDNMDNLLMQLFAASSDADKDVRKYVVRAFGQLAEVSPERIIPHIEGLVDYMTTQQKTQEDPELALDAAEFWLCVSEDPNLCSYLAPYLPKIIPVLLESMVYSEDDILELGNEEDDAHLDDKAEDIKPVFANAKSGRLAATNGTSTPANGASPPDANKGKDKGDQEEGELEEDGDDDDDDDGDDSPEDPWNLRKCSAATLDVLASTFHGPVFNVTLPYLKQNLVHTEWPHREAAVLALGAIADGCMEVVIPNLPDLIPYLISLLQDPEPVVRQITCWSLGRYSSWAAHLDPAGKQQFFEPMMDGILKRMLDDNKKVQEAAASAFANLEEKAGEELVPYCQVIINQFVTCLSTYKDRNMFILYDCIQTLAEHVGPSLAHPDLVQLLMPALLTRWSNVSDQSRELFPHLECLSYVVTALSQAFTPYAGPVFERCIRIVHNNLQDYMLAANNPIMDQPDPDFLVTTLDLLSAIIQALEESKSVELVRASQPNMFELLAFCMKDVNNEVRQSAYALLGDSAIYVFGQLQPHLPAILELLIAQLDLTQGVLEGDETSHSVVNNACWSVGEISMRQREAMAPYVDRLLKELGTILLSPKVPESLNENSAIAIGRLGTGSAQQLAPHLSTFAPFFVRAIHKVDWTDEKGQALDGFVKIISCNPQAMESCLLEFFAELAGAPVPFLSTPVTPDRKETFRTLLLQYKNLIPDFDTFLNRLPNQGGANLKRLYAL